MVRPIMPNQWRFMFDPLFDISEAFSEMVHRFLNDMHTLWRLMLDHHLDIGSTLDEMICCLMDDIRHIRRLMLHLVFDTGLSFNMMYRCLRYDMLMKSMFDHLLHISLTFDSMDERHLRKLIPDHFLIFESALLNETKTMDRIPDPPADVESCVSKVKIWSFGRGQSQFFQALSIIWTMAQKRRTFTGRCNEMLNSPQSSAPSPAKVIKPRKRIRGLSYREIKRQNEDLRQKINCQECKEKRRCVVFLPCRHMLLCWDCAAYVEKKCPSCKRDIEERIRAQFS